MSQSSPMNGRDGTYSYTKNSILQRDGVSAVKDAINETLMKNLDVEKLVCGSTSTRFAVADLGCSVGPNTFYAMESLIETLKQKCHQQGLDSDKLEFQVFFSDQIGNDFNTLFASLPHGQGRNYFAAAVPGSFHGRLFPSSSVHVAYCLFAIHWLSKLPEELLLKDSPAWNVGRIHYAGASDAVVKAYADQFERDMENFLRARAEEIVAGGMIIIVVPGVPDGVVDYDSLYFGFLESLLADMVTEELIEQEQVDLFNIPNVYPCAKDLRRVVERNGCFEIVKMEFGNVVVGGTMEPESFILQMRAIFERSMANHFGNAVVHQLFERAMQLKLDFARLLGSAGIHEIMGQVLAALKRK
ncbi:loganic acid O-methyltransferase-like [Salvia miltiorrhiza]|uniref:loganic acid O-methyltransferase-like n=1 Tax=Salvia miltiorrhiza TaxID=226208 RepID=UPI0025ACB098|nr:loganic acid O-methyltransferase-like [Salvia miltiorrhiza]